MDTNKLSCPYCNGEMKNGSLEIKGTWYSWFFFGFSYQNLYFNHYDESKDDVNEEKVIGDMQHLKGAKCKNCGAISFKPGDKM